MSGGERPGCLSRVILWGVLDGAFNTFLVWSLVDDAPRWGLIAVFLISMDVGVIRAAQREARQHFAEAVAELRKIFEARAEK